MSKNIFDDDETLLDYDAIDQLSAMGIGDRGYTNVSPPAGCNEVFDDQFERRAAEMQRTPASMKPIQLIETKKGPWSANNQFGIEQEFSPDPENNQTILKLPEWEFPQVWSVLLGSTLSADPSANYAVIASIEAGVGGITDTFEVDWQQGIGFSVVANALNITARFGTTTALPSDLRLKALVGKRPLFGSAPTRTFQVTAVAFGNTTIVRIPKYSKSVVILPGPAPNNDVYNVAVEYSQRNSTSSGFRANYTGADVLAIGSGARIPIAGNANFFRAFNNKATALAATLIFELGL